MSRTPRAIRRAEWAGLVLALAVLLGAFVRFSPPLTAGFPVGDGGMFAVMVDDLKASGYRLPEFTSYNLASIPFAYPPLGFYAGRLAADLFGLTAVEALRLVPPFFASLSVLAFYWLAWRLMQRRYHAAAAALFFALMPRAFSWFISGGGLTRSPGQLFLLLALAVTVRLYRENRRGDVLLAGLFAGLTILSHPEAAIHVIASIVFLWTVLGRSRSTFFGLAGTGIVALLVSAPWWVTVIRFHGLDPLLNAAQTGQKSLAVLNLVSFDFTEEIYASVIAVLGLVGLAHCLIRRDYLLPLWLLLPFLVEGRSAVLPAAIPLAMLAAVGLIDVVLLALFSAVGGERAAPETVSRVEAGIFVYLLFFLVFSSYQFGLQAAGGALARPDRQAMEWARENTASDARFLVLTGTGSVTCDWVLEWFPALAGRKSLLTVQGAEWTEGRGFASFVRSTYVAQNCLSAGDLACLDGVVDRSQYDFLYISKQPRLNCQPVNLPLAFQSFRESLQADPGFEHIYETEYVIIYGKRTGIP